MTDNINGTVVEDDDDDDLSVAMGADKAERRADERQAEVLANRGQQLTYLSRLIKEQIEDKKNPNPKPAFAILHLTDMVYDETTCTPGWITLDMHRDVPTKPKPASVPADRKWYDAYLAICRNSKINKMRVFKKWPSCWICDNVPQTAGTFQGGKKRMTANPRTFALGVLVEMDEEKYGDKDWHIALEDVPEIDGEGKSIEGKTKPMPRYVVINEAYNTYFAPLRDQFSEFMGDRENYTVCKDVVTMRQVVGGTKKQFTASVSRQRMRVVHPTKTVDGTPDGEPLVVDMDMRDPEIREFYLGQYGPIPSISKIAGKQATDDHYNYYFIPQPGDDVPATGGGREQSPAEKSPLSQEIQDDVKARIAKHRDAAARRRDA